MDLSPDFLLVAHTSLATFFVATVVTSAGGSKQTKMV
jgi:hypothetical protein